jgi:hypothetical protein
MRRPSHPTDAEEELTLLVSRPAHDLLLETVDLALIAKRYQLDIALLLRREAHGYAGGDVKTHVACLVAIEFRPFIGFEDMITASDRIGRSPLLATFMVTVGRPLFVLQGHAGYAIPRTGPQPPALRTRLVEAGYFFSIAAGRIGRTEKLPPQFGQTPQSTVSAQSVQNVHSKVQTIASVASGGRSLSQHSQLGRSSSIVSPFRLVHGHQLGSGACGCGR